jgi:hypothetical protein
MKFLRQYIYIVAGVPQGPSCSPHSTVYINGMPQTPGVNLGPFDDDNYIYATVLTEGFLRNLQRGLSFIETWCERWSIRINEDKSQAIYVSLRFRPLILIRILNGRNIPFVNHVNDLGAIPDNRITWSLHMEMIESKAFGTFVRICFLFKSGRLSANIKRILHKALIRSLMTYGPPA